MFSFYKKRVTVYFSYNLILTIGAQDVEHHLILFTIGAQQDVEHHLNQTTIGAQQDVEHWPGP